VDDNLFHQMQKLIAHLELSERTAFNPKAFCFAFKEPDGTPTNTVEQKDAQEFLNLLFDRLETALKPTKRKYLIDSIFGGHMVNQLVCKECGKAKDKLDKFLTLSVTVQEVKTLQESLAKLIEGETVSDYGCSGCNRKVDISMRKLLVETPNVLIVHLTRLVFNFETFANDKVNTTVEFPTILDLTPYSYYHVMKKEGLIKDPAPEGEGGEEPEQEPELGHKGERGKGDQQEEEEPKPVIIEDDCFEYKLAGACVHSGSANSGHYWSYINTERGDQGENAGKWTKEDEQAWMEYNDSSVSDWNFSRLKEDCFGDDPAQSRGWGNWGG
jgi:ubiquitin carboxyl-terminal hydrolase 34